MLTRLGSALILLLCWMAGQVRTERPLIGILAVENYSDKTFQKLYPGSTSYIAASYVKAVESSGARVIPIFVNETQEYYRDILDSVNGVLLPGGNTWLDEKDGYADAGRILIEEIKKINDKGTHFPILAICLGFELVLFLDNANKELRTDCHVKHTSFPLDFKDDFRESKLFKNASDDIVQILVTENVTVNSHIFCVTEKNMTTLHLTEKWRIISTNRDSVFNVTFVSAIESTNYPMTGLQFHPEKNIFEWERDNGFPHSPNAIRVARYFFDFFVQEAKLNDNQFKTKEEEYDHLISNFSPTFTRGSLGFDEVYLFKGNRSLYSLTSLSSYQSPSAFLILTFSLLASNTVLNSSS